MDERHRKPGITLQDGATPEKLVDPALKELEHIRDLAYLIQRDGSATVHIRGYAAEIDQAADLLSNNLHTMKRG